MSVALLTDAQIDALLTCQKRVKNVASREKRDGKHLRRDFNVVSVDEELEFILFTRQSTVIPESFSAGLRWRSKSGEELILLRYNGADHPHGNSLEHQEFAAQSHIHTATERYILAGKKAESFAQPTSLYRTLAGALHELMKATNTSGLQTNPDEPDMFDPSWTPTN